MDHGTQAAAARRSGTVSETSRGQEPPGSGDGFLAAPPSLRTQSQAQLREGLHVVRERRRWGHRGYRSSWDHYPSRPTPYSTTPELEELSPVWVAASTSRTRWSTDQVLAKEQVEYVNVLWLTTRTRRPHRSDGSPSRICRMTASMSSK